MRYITILNYNISIIISISICCDNFAFYSKQVYRLSNHTISLFSYRCYPRHIYIYLCIYIYINIAITSTTYKELRLGISYPLAAFAFCVVAVILILHETESYRQSLHMCRVTTSRYPLNKSNAKPVFIHPDLNLLRCVT